MPRSRTQDDEQNALWSPLLGELESSGAPLPERRHFRRKNNKRITRDVSIDWMRWSEVIGETILLRDLLPCAEGPR